MNVQRLKVLLVEDESPKIDQIMKVLNEINNIGDIRCVKSVNSALDALDEGYPDVIILDMSLPTIDVDVRSGEAGGRAQGFGGVEVLRYMVNLQIICPTIVVTGYEAFPREGGDVDLTCLKRELTDEFPEILKALLHYNSTNDTWKNGLKVSISDIYDLMVGGR